MPEMKKYRVAMVRSVEVMSTNAVSACRIAQQAFLYGQTFDNGVKLHPEENPNLEGTVGNTTSRIRDESIFAEEI